MQLADVTAPARGAYAELEDLIALRFPARQLRLARRNRALSVLAGPNKSNFRGRGIDFEEVRSYQPGDDIRSIDWRVTARTGSAHTKLFREERERPVLVAVDQRSSMFFGSSHCFKSVLAAQLASLLAWSALDGGDRVGGLVFNDAGHREIRPRRSRKTVLALLSQVAEYNQRPAPGGSRPREQLRRHAVQPAPHCATGQQPVHRQRLSRRRRGARPGAPVPAGPAHRDHRYRLQRPAGGRAAPGGTLCGDRRQRAQRTGHRRQTPAQPPISERARAAAGAVVAATCCAWVSPCCRRPPTSAPFSLLQHFYGEPRR